MDAVEDFELPGIEALRADREAVEACGSEGFELFCVDRAWVCLGGYLAAVDWRVDLGDGFEDCYLADSFQEGGRSASEENGFCGAAGEGAAADLLDDRVCGAVYDVAVHGVAVEVAIAALGGAERDVHVYGDRLGHLRYFSSPV